jgi:hypothetical protein
MWRVVIVCIWFTLSLSTCSSPSYGRSPRHLFLSVPFLSSYTLALHLPLLPSQTQLTTPLQTYSNPSHTTKSNTHHTATSAKTPTTTLPSPTSPATIYDATLAVNRVLARRPSLLRLGIRFRSQLMWLSTIRGRRRCMFFSFFLVWENGWRRETREQRRKETVKIEYEILTEHRYMAKAPTTAAEFDGSGKVWFKILDIGPTFTNQQASWDLWRMFSFPSSLLIKHEVIHMKFIHEIVHLEKEIS